MIVPVPVRYCARLWELASKGPTRGGEPRPVENPSWIFNQSGVDFVRDRTGVTVFTIQKLKENFGGGWLT
jgi:hypothetical protein